MQLCYFLLIYSCCFQYEGLQAENESLKDKLEEVSLELEIVRNEISEGGKSNFFCDHFSLAYA